MIRMIRSSHNNKNLILRTFFITTKMVLNDMKKAAYLIVIAVLLISMPAFAKNKDYVTATDIHKVNLNDTFDDVVGKIGEPQQVLSKELTADGKEQVTWQYETVKPPKFEGLIQPVANEKMAAQTVYQQQRANNPPYLVIFTDGKVSKIDRQKVEAVPTAQVNVQNY